MPLTVLVSVRDAAVPVGGSARSASPSAASAGVPWEKVTLPNVSAAAAPVAKRARLAMLFPVPVPVLVPWSSSHMLLLPGCRGVTWVMQWCSAHRRTRG
ncbi:hypothetical protein GCM10009540_25110 [Streptomyces turgidiscabies]